MSKKKQKFLPCLGCGYCCKKATCMLGASLHGPQAPCPELVFKDGKYRCRQVLNADPTRLAQLIEGLALGEGCCSPLNSDYQRLLSSSSSSPGRSSEDTRHRIIST